MFSFLSGFEDRSNPSLSLAPISQPPQTSIQSSPGKKYLLLPFIHSKQKCLVAFNEAKARKSPLLKLFKLFTGEIVKGSWYVFVSFLKPREQELLWDLLYRSRIRVRSDLLNTIRRHNGDLYTQCSNPYNVRCLDLDLDWLADFHHHGNGAFVLGVSSGGDDDSVQYGFPFFFFVDFFRFSPRKTMFRPQRRF